MLGRPTTLGSSWKQACGASSGSGVRLVLSLGRRLNMTVMLLTFISLPINLFSQISNGLSTEKKDYLTVKINASYCFIDII